MKIPKIIWLYWDNPDTMPWIIKFNIYKIKKNNSDFKLVVLNKNNYTKYIDLSMFDFNTRKFNTPQYFSDILRMFLLSKFGGIWIDSSLIIWKNLKNLIKENDELVFFENKHNSKGNTLALEIWFMATIPNHPFINKVKDIMIKLNTFHKIKKFLYRKLKSEKIIKQYNTSNKYHLTQHIINYICQKHPKLIKNIRLYNSDTAYIGHLKFLPKPIYFVNFNIFSFIVGYFIIKNYILKGEPKNIVVTKLTKGSRIFLEKKFSNN